MSAVRAGRLAGSIPLWLLCVACGSDYQVQVPEPPTPLPPVPPDSAYGQPPAWGSCYSGFHGSYYNLEADHPDVEAPEGEDPAQAYAGPDQTDWFIDRRLAFERFDASLDFGPGFWPVDEGWVGDPAYFAARWLVWVRAESRTTWQVSVGADDGLFLLIDGEVVLAAPALGAFEPQTVDIPLGAGQFPVEIYFAHRAGPDSALRFRALANDAVTLCYPDFEG